MDSEDLLDHISKKFPDIFDENRDINFDNILKLPDKYKLKIFDNIDLVYEFIEKEPGIFPELSPRLKNDKEVLLHAAKWGVYLLNDVHVKPIKDLELAFEIAKHGGIEFLGPSLKNSKELAIKFIVTIGGGLIAVHFFGSMKIYKMILRYLKLFLQISLHMIGKMVTVMNMTLREMRMIIIFRIVFI